MTDLHGVVPLDLAVLCEDCHLISAVRRDAGRQCPKCASESLLELETVLNRDNADAPPRHPVEVLLTIGAEQFDYVRYVLGLLSLEAEEHNAGSFQMFSGGSEGSYSLTTVRRNVSGDAFRAELMAWRARQGAALRTIGGELVSLPAGAVMGAEMILPFARGVADCAPGADEELSDAVL